MPMELRSGPIVAVVVVVVVAEIRAVGSLLGSIAGWLVVCQHDNIFGHQHQKEKTPITKRREFQQSHPQGICWVPIFGRYNPIATESNR